MTTAQQTIDRANSQKIVKMALKPDKKMNDTFEERKTNRMVQWSPMRNNTLTPNLYVIKERMTILAHIRSHKNLCWTTLVSLLLLLIIYYIPLPDVKPRSPPYFVKKPSFVGNLAINNELDRADILFRGKFNGAEASAMDKSNNLYTGVEGGFILYIDTNRNIVTKVAILNSNFTLYHGNRSDYVSADNKQTNEENTRYNYCHEDVLLYGERANYSPETIVMSRCSRPLGLRLSPDEKYLYVVDPMNGLFRVDLTKSMIPDDSASVHHLDLTAYAASILQDNVGDNFTKPSSSPQISYKEMRQVTLLLDAKQSFKSLKQTENSHILLVDDLVVDWAGGHNGGDIIYLTDASTRWSFRQYVFAMTEHDDSGRLLRYDTGSQQLNIVSTITPVRYRQGHQAGANFDEEDIIDGRNLIFLNGIELMDDRQAILINEFGSARILKHYIRGPREGSTELWAWAPGWPDNIKRGADFNQETYWVGTGCALDEADKFSFINILIKQPIVARTILKVVSLSGGFIEFLGEYIFRSELIRDFGYSYRTIWSLGADMCPHAIIVQFDRDGNVLRSLQTTNKDTMFKSITEVREILLPTDNVGISTDMTNADLVNFTSNQGKTKEKSNQRYLYLFSVIYNYLGRIELQKI